MFEKRNELMKNSLPYRQTTSNVLLKIGETEKYKKLNDKIHFHFI